MMPGTVAERRTEQVTTDDRPGWAQQIFAARRVRGWSQQEAIRQLRASAAVSLPDDESLARWESGKYMPGDFYRPLIAALFGMAVGELFPEAALPVPVAAAPKAAAPGRFDFAREALQRAEALDVRTAAPMEMALYLGELKATLRSLLDAAQAGAA